MTRKTSKSLLILIALALTPLVGAGDLHTEYFDQSYPLADGGSVSLDNVNGDVVVQVWDQAEVRVQAEKRASTMELLQELKIEVHAGRSSVEIDTEYPNSRPGDRHGDRKMSVEYTLTVPRYAAINGIDLVNGNLEVVGVMGGIDADLVNGTVEVREVSGGINLSAVNGSIRPTIDDFSGVTGIQLESVNGAVELVIPSYAGASLDVETVNGTIGNNFGLEVKKGKYVGASLNGDIGGGGVMISIETVNGRIDIDSR